jgi:hypothetical protein
VFRLSKGGTTWSPTSVANYNDAVCLAEGSGVLFAGVNNGPGTLVFQSSDDGLVWEYPSLFHVQVDGLSTFSLAANFDTVFAATSYGIFKRGYHDTTWVLIPDVFGNPLLSSKEGLFVGTSYRSILRSTDNGGSWRELAVDGLKGNIVVLADSDRFIFAGCTTGFYVSTDTGNTWHSFNTGLVDSNITSIALKAGNLYVGTGSLGVWRRPLSEMIGSSAVAEHPQVNAASAQAYPNPFSQSTTIRFTSAERGFAEITVVNLLDEQVARLFAGELDAGEHAFEWDAKDAAAGTYFCIARWNDRVERVAILLAR